jgi:AhpD family alkylhydroperoxidase
MTGPKPRMSIVTVCPELVPAIQAITKAVENNGVPLTTLAMAHLRASQINGCSVCCDMHPRMMKASGESDARIYGVAAWRDSPLYSPAERAALALTEAVTRMADREDPVPDAVWEEAARHYDEKGLAALLVNIAAINVWNRLNVSTHQVPQEWRGTAGWGAAKDEASPGGRSRTEPVTG